jgi:hypothetical protein
LICLVRISFYSYNLKYVDSFKLGFPASEFPLLLLEFPKLIYLQIFNGPPKLLMDSLSRDYERSKKLSESED